MPALFDLDHKLPDLGYAAAGLAAIDAVPVSQDAEIAGDEERQGCQPLQEVQPTVTLKKHQW